MWLNEILTNIVIHNAVTCYRKHLGEPTTNRMKAHLRSLLVLIWVSVATLKQYKQANCTGSFTTQTVSDNICVGVNSLTYGGYSLYVKSDCKAGNYEFFLHSCTETVQSFCLGCHSFYGGIFVEGICGPIK